MELVDCAAIAQTHRNELEAMNNSELRSPEAWLPETRQAVSGWRTSYSELMNTSVPPKVKAGGTPFGIWLYLQKHRLRISDKEVRRIESILLATRKRRSVADRLVIEEVARPYLSMTHFNLILSRETKSGLYDSDNMSGFYRTKFLRSASAAYATSAKQQKIRELFEIAAPDYSPKSAREFMALCKDKRIKNLRDLIQRATNGDELLDRAFFESSLLEVFNAERRVEGMRKRTALYTAPLTLALAMCGFHGSDIVREAVVTGVEKLARRSMLKNYQWLLLLIDRQKHPNHKR